MSVRKKKEKTAGYNAASRRSASGDIPSIVPAERLATATLILTPKLIHRFGRVFRAEFRLETSLLSVSDLYQEAVMKNLLPVARSKSVPDFEDRVRKGMPAYSKRYNDILWECERVLGTSRFKVEYVKQLTETHKELQNLPFASLDLNELFRRHLACCRNAAAHYEELFEADSPNLYLVDQLIRTSNYGLTVLVLLLEGALAGPIWIMGELRRLTSEALHKMELMPEIHANPSRLSGSLVFAEGVLDPPETRKLR